ncbi:MAG: hypothetical protein NHB36_00150 [Nitrospira sp.]|nr:hypothetical protein [Nitrospira sp.]
MEPPDRQRAPTAREGDHRRQRLRRVVPLVIVLLFVGIIVVREVPVAGQWLQRVIAPAEWAAAEACRSAALKLVAQPDYARIVAPGRIHATARGFYVENIVVGQMGARGTEERLSVNCYADAEGNVVSVGAAAGLEPTPKPGD